MMFLYLLIVLLVGIGIGVFIARARPQIDKGERQSYVRHRKFISHLTRLATQHASTEPFAVILSDELDTFIQAENRSIK